MREGDWVVCLGGEGYVEPLEVGGCPFLGVAEVDYFLSLGDGKAKQREGVGVK